MPLSFDGDGERFLLATPADSPTGRNLAAGRTVRLALGPTRDVTVVDGDVEVLEVDALPRERGDAFAARTAPTRARPDSTRARETAPYHGAGSGALFCDRRSTSSQRCLGRRAAAPGSLQEEQDMHQDDPTRPDLAPVSEVMGVLRQIVSDVLRVPVTSVTADSALSDLPSVESIKLLRIAGKVERRFDIELDNEALFRKGTLDDLAREIVLVRERAA